MMDQGSGYSTTQQDASNNKKQSFLDVVARPRNPWLIGAFGVSSLLAGLHLGKGSCRDGGSPFDCILGALYTGAMGFSGAMLMMQEMPDPDDPGTPVTRSPGEDP